MEISQQLQDFFKEEKVTIRLFPDSTTRSFKSLKAFYDYMIKERTFWNDLTAGRSAQVRSNFYGIVSNIENALSHNDFNQQKIYLRNAINNASNNGFPNVYSSTIIGQFIKERYYVHQNQAEAACLYFFNNTVQINNKDLLDGFLHSFFLQHSNEVAATTIDVEKDSLQGIRESFSDELNKLHNDYIERLEEIDKNYKEYKDSIENWRNDLQLNSESFLKEKQGKLQDLEHLYNEKLRLESPAKYWKDLSEEYEDKGKKWRTWTLLISMVFIIYFTIVLFNVDNLPFVQDKVLNFNNLRNTIIIMLLSSIFVYVISLFIKLSTSSFHLSRDAKERFQLTHVYLSLLQEKGVSESERTIILQSIFSRADTGLIKGESTPAFPDSTLAQLFKNLK